MVGCAPLTHPTKAYRDRLQDANPPRRVSLPCRWLQERGQLWVRGGNGYGASPAKGPLSVEETIDETLSHPGSEEPPRFLPLLAVWTVLTVVTLCGLWVAGFRTRGLIEAVDRGA